MYGSISFDQVEDGDNLLYGLLSTQILICTLLTASLYKTYFLFS